MTYPTMKQSIDLYGRVGTAITRIVNIMPFTDQFTLDCLLEIVQRMETLADFMEDKASFKGQTTEEAK